MSPQIRPIKQWLKKHKRSIKGQARPSSKIVVGNIGQVNQNPHCFTWIGKTNDHSGIFKHNSNCAERIISIGHSDRRHLEFSVLLIFFRSMTGNYRTTETLLGTVQQLSQTCFVQWRMRNQHNKIPSPRQIKKHVWRVGPQASSSVNCALANNSPYS